MARYDIPVNKALLVELFAEEYPQFKLSKRDARCLLGYVEGSDHEVWLDVIHRELYLADISVENGECWPIDLVELVTFAADNNYDLQEQERRADFPDGKFLADLKRDNNRLDRIVDRMGE